MCPQENPDFERRTVKPFERSVFGGKYEFTTFRDLNAKTLSRNIESYVVSNNLGRIVWPTWDCLKDTRLEESVRELRRRGLFLFDVCGYVPGSDVPQKFWRQFRPDRSTLDLFDRELGDRWMGMDNGEQDNRYLKSFAWRYEPIPGGDRFRHFLNFRRHFDKMENDLGHRLSALVGTTLSHSLLREGGYMAIGAETSQVFPNTQILYSFIRGAGKQYGVPWFGNVSVYTLFGWKDVTKTNLQERADGHLGGRIDKGSSLALMKRLSYEQIFYNCWFGGFEIGHFNPDGTLSSIGRMQKDMIRWYAENGDPGVMCTPVALMTDVFAGWNVPQISEWPVAETKYRVWGTLPYDAGDYFTHGVCGLLYPGYENSHFFHDERGYVVPTPYGDIADCILSDAPFWLLRQYAVVVLAGRMSPSEETSDVLRRYVREGGHLVLTRGNVRILFPEGFGAVGKGKVTEITTEWGVEEKVCCVLPVRSGIDRSLPNPHPLTDEARKTLDRAFRSVQLFGTGPQSVDANLSLIACRRSRGDYTIAVLNNTWREQPFEIVSYIGEITSVKELPTDISERKEVGFSAWDVPAPVVGRDSASTIAAGAVRMFRVAVREKGVEVLDRERPVRNPKGRTLSMDGSCSIVEFVRRRPTFFRHWDGVKVPVSYLLRHDKSVLRDEGEWCRRQGLDVMLDFSDAMNGFADMRLLSRDAVETARSDAMLDDIIDKAALFRVTSAVFALHATCANGRLSVLPEDLQEYEQTLRRVTGKISAAGMTTYLRMSPFRLVNDFRSEDDWVARANNLRFKPSVATAVALSIPGLSAAERLAAVTTRQDDLWLLAAPASDVNGTAYTYSDPIAEHPDDIRPYLHVAAQKGVRVVFDAVYPDRDAEYRDVRLFEEESTK